MNSFYLLSIDFEINKSYDLLLKRFDENVQINIERRVGRGDAKEVICKAVQKLRADMLVIA